MASAMPQAMDLGLATPTMSARLPARNPMVQFSLRLYVRAGYWIKSER
jgi:hypothetical protein